MAGIKRDSPGADEEKKNPLQDVELSDEDAVRLSHEQKALAKTELALERVAQQKLSIAYAKRRAVVKTVPKFWPVAFMNHEMIAVHAQHGSDQLALSYLEDFWVDRDKQEPRCYTLEFHFKENPFFSNTILKKEYKYVPPPAAKDETPDEDGITESSLDFSWHRDVAISGTKIDWKDPSKALTKLYPREKGEEDDDIPAENGSFFNYFDHDDDPFDIGITLANEIFPEAVEYFLGTAEGHDTDSEEEDSEDDDADEIDLEKPRPKKRKV